MAETNATRLLPRTARAAVQGSSTLLVTLILLLLSGSCLALLMATQTQLLIASQHKVQVRLLAAADGGVELGVARGIAGAGDPVTRTLGGVRRGAEVRVDVSGFVPLARGACHLCMTNLEGTLGSLGGLRRVSHVVSASAHGPSRSDGLPPPVRKVSATVDLMPWPTRPRDRRDLATARTAARREVRQAALGAFGAYEDGAPFTVATLDGSGAVPRTVAVGGSGRALLAVETEPRPGLLWTFADTSDEDGNGAPDLGHVVAAPAIVTLRLGGRTAPIAVFGGGWDPNRPNEVGNWLYLVEIDSGALIGKRRVDAPVAASPAAADLDGDGVADRFLVGTLAGSLYRVDVSSPAQLANGRLAASAWTPELAFETGGLPILHPPAVAPAQEPGVFVLALGAGGRVGHRPSPGAGAGRFFVLVDDGSGRVVSAAALTAVDPAGEPPGPDRLAPELPPSAQGWSLTLEPGEQPASPPLAVAGLLTFLSFRPTGIDRGDIRSYALLLRSGARVGAAPSTLVRSGAVLPSPDLGSVLRMEVDYSGSSTAPLLSPGDEGVLALLREERPASCRFGGARVRLVGVGPDAAPLRLAVLPVCRIDVDWFEAALP